MGDSTAISWTDRTWNPWRGCEHVSSGCANCYMFSEQRRYGGDPTDIVRTKTWGQPRKWNREAEEALRRDLVFTCSWSDFFIPAADPWRAGAWEVIRSCSSLDFQILTKRPERIASNLPDGWPYNNVWLGVSVENRKQGVPRVAILREIPAAVRFLSVEPLLEDLGEIDLTHIDWVIAGGESGPGHRPMDPAWAESVRDQCQAAKIPFFFKQSAGPCPGMGTTLKGETHLDFPSPRVVEAA